jgi:hypothetical protein
LHLSIIILLSHFLIFLSTIKVKHHAPLIRTITGHILISLLSLQRFDLLLLPTTLLSLLNKALLVFRLLLIVILSEHHLNVTDLEAVAVYSTLHVLLLLRSPHNPFFDCALCD